MMNSCATVNSIIQEASAGTGKTHALSSRYLELLADGVDPVTILATTFTRKGAGEILDRVVDRLAQAAKSEDEARGLGTSLSRSIDRPQAIRMLRRLIEALPKLQIGTLDGFFNRVAQAFCFEIGLSPRWKIVDAVRINAIRDQAIERILDNQATVQLLRLMSKSEADRRIADAIATTVEELFEIYRDSIAEAWSMLVGMAPVSQAQALEIAERFRGLNHADLNAKLIEQLEKAESLITQGRWDDLPDLGIIQKVLSGDTKYNRKEMPSEVVSAIARAIEATRRQLLFLLNSRNQATRDLLREFDQAIQPIQLESGELTFSDVTFHLARSLTLKADALAARLGASIDHLLLDEFQDTSSQQWAIVRPIAEHVTTPGTRRSFFCVGDRKQAIYGWRGGVDRIFDAVQSELNDRLTVAPPLIVSRRSCPTIIAFVNRVFGSLGTLVGGAPSPENTTFHKWAKQFVSHQSGFPKQQGFVQVRRATPDDDNTEETDKREILIQEAVQEIIHMHSQFPKASIGVLLRNNEPIAQLSYLLQRMGVPTSEEAGNPLTDSAMVEVVLSALSLADHPDDGLARFHLSHSPLGLSFGLSEETQGNQQQNIQIAHRVSAELRAELVRDGYGVAVCRWAGILAGICTDREALRLEQLIEQAYAYDSSWTMRSRKFVELIRLHRVSDRTGARIRLMTMHSAKGLDFDIVLVPLLNLKGGWSTHTPAVVTGRSNPAGRIDLVCRYVSKSEQKFLPDSLAQAFDVYAAAQVNEELCLLYVALTRAKRHLVVLLPPGIKADQNSMSGVLIRTLKPNAPPEEAMIFQDGQVNWQDQSQTDEPPMQPETRSEPTKLRLATENRTGRGIPWNRPSARPSERKSFGLTISTRSQTKAIERGILLHECFRQLPWLEQAPSESRLRRKLVHLASNSASVDLAITEFAELLAQRNVQRWLRRESYTRDFLERNPDSLKLLHEPLRFDVITERQFVFEADREFLEGSIDRIVLVSEGLTPIAAEVFDFKSGKYELATIDRAVESFQKQMQTYLRAVQEAWNIPAPSTRGFLVFPDIDLIRPMSEKLG